MTANTVRTSSKQFWKISLILFAATCATVVIGAIIGIAASGYTSTKRVPVLASANPEVSAKRSDVTLESTEIPSPKLWLPGVAVVNMARVLAAHPSTTAHYEFLQQKPAAIPPTADKKTRQWKELVATLEWTESQKFVFRDVQQVIAAYAAKHNLTMVVDCTVYSVEPASTVFYSPSEVDFHQIINAPGVKDITENILQELARERPNGILLQPQLQPLPKLESRFLTGVKD